MDNELEVFFQEYPGTISLEGFNSAIIGTAQRERSGPPVLVYSFDKIIEILMENDEMDYDEAVEYYGYNIEGSYMGEQTPIFLYTI
jgi:hypothetical protein